MKMRATILLVVLGIMTFAVIGCGAASSDNTLTVDTQTESTSESEVAEIAVSETEEAETAVSETENAEPEISIDEQVWVDQDGIKITATGFGDEEAKKYCTLHGWDFAVSVTVENNTDQNIAITTVEGGAVNGYMVDSNSFERVAAEDTAEGNIYFRLGDLKEAGIEHIGKLGAFFSVVDSETDIFIDELGFAEIKTSDYDNMDFVEIDGTELYNANGIRIVVQAPDENGVGTHELLIYIENNSDEVYGVYINELYVNGDLYSTSNNGWYLSSGEKGFSAISYYVSAENENDVEISFEIYSYTGETVDDFTDLIKINAQ